MYCPILILCFVASVALGQTVNIDTLPTTNALPWQPGIQGGIPNYSVGPSVVTYGALGDGVHDDYPAFTNAMAHCSNGQYVYAPQPSVNYVLSNTVIFSNPQQIEFRGDGPSKTKIVAYGPSGAFKFGGNTSRNTTTVVSGYTRSSRTMVVTASAGFSVGNLCRFYNLLDDPAECFGTFEDPPPHQAQMMVLTNISGNTLTFDTPLYYSNYNASFTPTLDGFTSQPIKCGLNSLSIVQAGSFDNIVYSYVAQDCWMTNVFTTNSVFAHVAALDNLRFTVQGCQFWYHQAYDSNTRYGVQLGEYSTACLIENNVIQGHNVAVVMQYGACGNVASYNFTDLGFSVGSPVANVQAGGYDCHGDVANFNCFEGDVGPFGGADDFWGCNRTLTMLRNWWTRVNRYNFSGSISTIGPAVYIDSTNYYFNVVGNIMGLPNQAGYNNSANPTMMIGYERRFGPGPPTSPVNDVNVAPRSALLSNWDYATATIMSNSISGSVPKSYYLASAPAFWCSTMPWPPVGPDINTGNSITNVAVIPAQVAALGGSCSTSFRIARVTKFTAAIVKVGP